MKKNMSNLDRGIRIVIGVAVLSLILFLSGGIRWIGLLGLIPLVTGIFGFCPLYAIFKIKTN